MTDYEDLERMLSDSELEFYIECVDHVPVLIADLRAARAERDRLLDYDVLNGTLAKEVEHLRAEVERLKRVEAAVCGFVSEDEGAVLVHPGTYDEITRLDVPTDTWETLCGAADEAHNAALDRSEAKRLEDLNG